MKRVFSFSVLSLVIFLTVFSFTQKSVLADGMMFGFDPYSNG
jgi:hypothetical protein